MKRRILSSLAAALAIALSAQSVWAFGSCPFAGGSAGSAPIGGFVKIKGTLYEIGGVPTRISCDSDTAMIGLHTFDYPGTEYPDEFTVGTLGCGALDQAISEFVGHGGNPAGVATQIVSNGSPRNECVFHGGTTDLQSTVANWAVFTVRKYDREGNPTVETGTMTLNTQEGVTFVGKISIRYP